MSSACTFLLTFLVYVLCGLTCGQLAQNLTPLDIGVRCAQYPRTPTVLTFVVDQPDANLLLLHFDFVKLMPQDTLTLRAVVNHTVGAVIDTLTSATTAPFYSVPMYTPLVVLELHVVTGLGRSGPANATTRCFGFHVDGVRTSAIDGNKAASADESICGTDDSKNAQCFVNSAMYTASKAVVRLLTNRVGGSAFCTGWLLGCEGHLLTNEHCIQDATDAGNTLIEFMAEGVSCGTNCDSQMACAATPRLYTRGATFIAASTELDYSIVKLDPAMIPEGLG
ncbi:hypothetical protein DYB25_009094 [Aphanomyces astaci]|uniref:Serine protease n=1 Tax=Aphanomyces astaci TaxID=112090 RepID=A0A397DDS2_APHAT|nr:hypothetical protein DYB25_009094 [Aphanomyces astaci]RHY63171.1 hypothetical protein DYB38_010461 [Aphanomyces astaci]RHZ19769.1 hypothetical protein DYB26_006564 [Aphanomyces astaci]RHZ38233.1 hypothetical protein DYB31_003353 [Aphanomyces astaci]